MPRTAFNARHTDGAPAGCRLPHVGDAEVSGEQWSGADPRVPLTVNGVIPLHIAVDDCSWANWVPQLMHHPVWSTGGTDGIAQMEVFLRPAGSSSGTLPGPQVMLIETAVDAPAPQGRYRVNLDATSVADGDDELFVQATTPSGLKSHPIYGDEVEHFEATVLSNAHDPIPLRICNSAAGSP